MIAGIHERAEFRRLTREGTRVRSGVLWCTMLSDPTCDRPHVAFAISRAVGTAVVRNRLRRQLRALMQARADRVGPGWYLIGTVPAAAGRSSSRLAVDLDRIISSAR